MLNTNNKMTLTLFNDEAPREKPKGDKHKDWKGNANSIFKTLASSAHTEEERKAFDYYATDPAAAEMLLELEEFDNNIWEPACGQGHLSIVFEQHGYNVKSTDLIDRGFGEKMDFLSIHNTFFDGDIVTNPPYRIYISSSRINCAKNGNFEGLRDTGGSAVAYAWYVWKKGFTGDTTLKWFN